MAIWSLTQERVDKLLQQIGEREQEIDTLIKLSAKDLWTRDLDDFIGEWRFQLDDEAKRAKKVANYGRRASNKLKLPGKGAGAKKGKAKAENDDDSDFEVAKPKKSGGPVRVQAKPVSSFFTALKNGNAPPKAAAAASQAKAVPAKVSAAQAAAFDGSSDPVEVPDQAVQKPVSARAAPPETAGTITSDASAFSKAPARKSRLAASKPIKYGDSDSDSDDDLLGDVSKMVKGIGAGAVADHSKLGTKPLFAASTAKVTGGVGVAKATEKEKRDPAPAINLLEDDTEFSSLAPKPTATEKASAPGASGNGQLNAISDDSDEDFAVAPVPAKPVVKSVAAAGGAKAKKQPTAATTTTTKKAATAPKTTKAAPALSPAAKAYAAKRGLKKRVIESDSDESDYGNGEGVTTTNVKGPGKSLAAMAASSEKEDEDVDMSDDDDDDAPPIPPPARQRPAAPAAAAAASTRPARRAAATAGAKKASKYVELSSDSESEAVLDDDEDDDQEEDYSEGDSE